MDTLRHMIKFFLKVAFAFFFAAFVWWCLALVYPSLSFGQLMTSLRGGNASSTDILPSPRRYGGLLGKTQAPSVTTNLYTHGDAFNGYNLNNNGYSYSTYSYTSSNVGNTIAQDEEYIRNAGQVKFTQKGGTVISQAPTTTNSSPNAFTNNRSSTIRNLSIYEGGHIYTGLTFIGEAKSSMFRQGRFPIVMVDQTGKAIGVSAAVAESDWTIPGWTRFSTKINYALPVNTPCTMVFEEALLPNEKTRQPFRVPLRVRCN